MQDTDSQRETTATDAPPDEQTPADHHRDAAAPHPRADDARADGGTASVRDGANASSQEVDYLDREVNIFKPSTPFMRDHLRVVWTMFVLWAIVVFAPVTATAIAPETMTGITVLGFPLHYALTAIGGPAGALVLSFVYARKRDQLDDDYGIDHGTDAATGGDEEGAAEPTATDGGVEQ